MLYVYLVELPDILGDLLLRLVWLTLTFFVKRKWEEEEEKKRFELLPLFRGISFNTENQMQN